MKDYPINDLYVSAFLRARWHECRIESTSYKRFSFIFSIDAKKDVDLFMSGSNDFNVNASKLINEVKALKSYISNNN